MVSEVAAAVVAVAIGVTVVFFVFDFYFAGGAWTWMRQAPWYLPCGEAVCIVYHEFVACVYV